MNCKNWEKKWIKILQNTNTQTLDALACRKDEVTNFVPHIKKQINIWIKNVQFFNNKRIQHL